MLCYQCEQIGSFLKNFGKFFWYKSSPNIWQIFLAQKQPKYLAIFLAQKQPKPKYLATFVLRSKHYFVNQNDCSYFLKIFTFYSNNWTHCVAQLLERLLSFNKKAPPSDPVLLTIPLYRWIVNDANNKRQWMAQFKTTVVASLILFYSMAVFCS